MQGCEKEAGSSAVCREQDSLTHKSKVNKAAEKQTAPSLGRGPREDGTHHGQSKREKAHGPQKPQGRGLGWPRCEPSGRGFPVWEPGKMSSWYSPSKEHLRGHFCSTHTDLYPRDPLEGHRKPRTGETPKEKQTQSGVHCGHSLKTPGALAGSMRTLLELTKHFNPACSLYMGTCPPVVQAASWVCDTWSGGAGSRENSAYLRAC